MKPEEAPLSFGRFSDDDPVVRRPKLDGVRVPLFGEDVWDLSCMGRRPNKAHYTLRFNDLSQDRARLAKELFAHRINSPVPSSRRRKVVRGYAADTCAVMLVQLRRLYVFMDVLGVGRIEELTQEHLNQFHSALIEAMPGHARKMTRAVALQVAVWLWESRDHLSEGGLSFDPWAGTSTIDVVGYVRPRETLTPRIPEAVVSMLLRWALEYVDGFSADIIASHHALQEPPRLVQVLPGEGEADRFARFVALLGAAGKRLPAEEYGGDARPCRALIEAGACLPTGWLKSYAGRALLRRAIVELGLDLDFLPAPRHVPDGCATPVLSCTTVRSLRHEARHLVAAAYVLCAYLSGMRDSEVQDLRRGCVEVMRDERGQVYRHKVRGRTYKGQESPIERTWVVIEPVARAIAVLERITAAQHAATGDDHLFVHLDKEYGDALLKGTVNALVNRFAAHCGGVLAGRITPSPPSDAAGSATVSLGPIPHGPDGAWRFTTRQFRKTLAWHIANRKFGVVAGMIQYGHATAMMFEGYAGDSRSEFRAEVAQEEFLARLGDVTTMYADALVGIETAGPMAEELKVDFAQIASVIGELKGEVVDDGRLNQLLRMKAASMRVGELAHCFWEPAQARCQSHLTLDERVEPVIGLCDPDCPRACWTRDHLDAYRRLEREAEDLSRRNRVSPLQRDVLRRQAVTFRARIAAIEEAARGQAG